jgi:predicted ribosome quality control (RQC) complex YloA/Tae2 family protein
MKPMKIAGLILLRWVAEAGASLVGIKCRRILFFPETPALVLHLAGRDDRFLLLPNGRQVQAPCIFDTKAQLSIFPGEPQPTEKFNLLRSRQLVDISGKAGDRRIWLHFGPRPDKHDDSPITLIMHLMGARSLCLLADEAGKILATDRPSVKYPAGQEYVPPPPPEFPELTVMSFPEFTALLRTSEDLSLPEILERKIWGIDKELAELLTFEIEAEKATPEVGIREQWQTFAAIKTRLRSFLSLETCVAFDPVSETITAILPRNNPTPGLSINTLWQIRLAQNLQARSADDIEAVWEKFAAEQLKKVQRAETALQARLADAARAELYKKYAETLGIHRHMMAKGERQVVLPDPFGGDEKLTIALDPARGLQGNIEEYYKKHRRALAARAALAEEHSRLAQIRHAAEEIITAIRNAAEGDGPLPVEQWRSRFEQLGIRPPATAAKTGKPKPARRLPYWEFTLPGGEIILVGRSARDNDELTLNRAAKTDWFLHARQSKGAHVILRHQHAETPPAVGAIRLAAAAAAFFSEARHSAVIPVAYTPVKYVRKPRKAPPGLVSLLREQTILVEPLPPPGYHAQ